MLTEGLQIDSLGVTPALHIEINYQRAESIPVLKCH